MARAPDSQNARGRFPETQWSDVLGARDANTFQGKESLAKLCSDYWYPIYATLRCRGYSPEDAEDLAQDFFYRLLEKDVLTRADPDRGRFRAFLLACLNNFLHNKWDERQALRRGAGSATVSIDAMQAENRYRAQPTCDLTPDKVFDQSWALSLLERVREQLHAEFEASGSGDLFTALEGYLPAGRLGGSYSQVAIRWSMNESAVRMMVSRLRRRFGEKLRSEIAHTVATTNEIDDEVQYLCDCLSR
jgi:DNA-directed RNA polymerase specialized sigma24 family protein